MQETQTEQTFLAMLGKYKKFQYDPDVIQRYAYRLHQKAQGMTIVMSIVTAFAAGSLVYSFLNYALHTPEIPQAIVSMTIFGALAGGLVGHLWGREIAFTLKARAQMALCLLKIEENTRRKPE
jgi:hypothetical protein